MVQIHVPEDIGSELRVLPEGPYEGILKGLTLKMSSTKNPMLIGRFIIQTEYQGKKGKDFQSTIGETVLEMYSLAPQALFNLNSLYKKVTGERLPQGDYDEQEFTTVMNDRLGNSRWAFEVYTEPANEHHDDDRSKIRNLVFMG